MLSVEHLGGGLMYLHYIKTWEAQLIWATSQRWISRWLPLFALCASILKPNMCGWFSKTYWRFRPDLFQDEIGHWSIGVYDDGGYFVVTDLLEERRGVQVVVQHPDRQRLPWDEETADQFLQPQQACMGGGAEQIQSWRSVMRSVNMVQTPT